jgi:hypothetical protein
MTDPRPTATTRTTAAAEEAFAAKRTARSRANASSDARQMLDAAVNEADFMWQIIQLARLVGFKTYHPYDSRRSAVGYPDLTLVHAERRVFLWVEVKRHDGILTPAQEGWRDAIRAAGGDWRVWRPQDWESEIVPTLKGAA